MAGQIGARALGLLAGIVVAIAGSAFVLAELHFIRWDEAFSVALIAGATSATGAGVIAMLRRRISALSRDIGQNALQMNAVRAELIKAAADLMVEVKAVKNTADALFPRESLTLRPLDQATIFEFEWSGKKIRFDITPYHHIHQEIRNYRSFYEPEMLKYIEQKIGKGGAIVDVGANIGNHAVFFGAVMGADPLVCIEASPSAVRHLKRNLELNGVEGARIVEKAVGAKAGQGGLFLALDQAGNPGAARLIEGQGSIPISTLDAELAALGVSAVRMMKIDVEGMEAEVLTGGLRTLEKSKPHLFVELQTDAAVAGAMEILSKLGYRLGPRFNFIPTYHIYCES